MPQGVGSPDQRAWFEARHLTTSHMRPAVGDLLQKYDSRFYSAIGPAPASGSTKASGLTSAPGVTATSPLNDHVAQKRRSRDDVHPLGCGQQQVGVDRVVQLS